MGEERTQVPLGSQMWKAESLGKALSSSSVESSSNIEELTAVGEEGVIEGGGEDNLVESCYNPFSSSFYFTFHSYSLSTYLER